MYKHVCQTGQISILYSIGNTPLLNWKVNNKFGIIKRVTDSTINSLVLEFKSINSVNDYLECPKDPIDKLKIYMKFVVLIIKNVESPFSFELETVDIEGGLRKFRMSTYTNRIAVHPYTTTMPLVLYPNWNTVVMNLDKLSRDCYGVGYSHTLKVRIYASFLLRRMFFSDRPYKDEELPMSYRLKITPNLQEPLVVYK